MTGLPFSNDHPLRIGTRRSPLALAQAGHKVLMHGSNAFTSGMPVLEALLTRTPSSSHSAPENGHSGGNFSGHAPRIELAHT